MKEFCREFQCRRKGYNVTCNEINNLKSSVSIANMFATKFSSVSGRTDHADNGDESLCQILNHVAPSHMFDTNDIKKAVTRLSTGL